MDPVTDEEMMRDAIITYQLSMPYQALELLDKIAARGTWLPKAHFLRGLCFARVGDFGTALHWVEAEIAANPDFKEARQEAETLRRLIDSVNKTRDPKRQFSSALPREAMLPIELASFRYTYKGIRLTKNPFDFALYPLLLWDLKPRTVLEIGSFHGGSAVWVADLLQTFGVDAHVHSVDVNRVTDVSHPRVTYYKGDGQNLGATFTPQFLASIPRPLLVIEDADHSRNTTLAVCEFFHPILRPGEYMVVEDGMTSLGPRMALDEFLKAHSADYLVDGQYCDFFGYNYTWCVNGWLRKLTPAASQAR